MPSSVIYQQYQEKHFTCQFAEQKTQAPSLDPYFLQIIQEGKKDIAEKMVKKIEEVPQTALHKEAQIKAKEFLKAQQALQLCRNKLAKFDTLQKERKTGKIRRTNSLELPQKCQHSEERKVLKPIQNQHPKTKRTLFLQKIANAEKKATLTHEAYLAATSQVRESLVDSILTSYTEKFDEEAFGSLIKTQATSTFTKKSPVETSSTKDLVIKKERVRNQLLDRLNKIVCGIIASSTKDIKNNSITFQQPFVELYKSLISRRMQGELPSEIDTQFLVTYVKPIIVAGICAQSHFSKKNAPLEQQPQYIRWEEGVKHLEKVEEKYGLLCTIRKRICPDKTPFSKCLHSERTTPHSLIQDCVQKNVSLVTTTMNLWQVKRQLEKERATKNDAYTSLKNQQLLEEKLTTRIEKQSRQMEEYRAIFESLSKPKKSTKRKHKQYKQAQSNLVQITNQIKQTNKELQEAKQEVNTALKESNKAKEEVLKLEQSLLTVKSEVVKACLPLNKEDIEKTTCHKKSGIPVRDLLDESYQSFLNKTINIIKSKTQNLYETTQTTKVTSLPVDLFRERVSAQISEAWTTPHVYHEQLPSVQLMGTSYLKQLLSEKNRDAHSVGIDNDPLKTISKKKTIPTTKAADPETEDERFLRISRMARPSSNVQKEQQQDTSTTKKQTDVVKAILEEETTSSSDEEFESFMQRAPVRTTRHQLVIRSIVKQNTSE